VSTSHITTASIPVCRATRRSVGSYEPPGGRSAGNRRAPVTRSISRVDFSMSAFAFAADIFERLSWFQE
jgi:hypothetical protein